MRGTDAFKIEGLVIEALANGTYRVELANGHRLLGFVAGSARKSHAGFAPGQKVKLNLTPYDLSSGQIVVRTEEI